MEIFAAFNPEVEAEVLMERGYLSTKVLSIKFKSILIFTEPLE